MSIELPSAAAFRRGRAGLRRGPGLSQDVARSPLSILGCAARPPLNLKSNPKNSKPCPERNRTRLKLDRVALELVVKRWSLNAEELGRFLFVPVTLRHGCWIVNRSILSSLCTP